MAIEIFKLMGSILVNNDEANKSISKTDEKAEGLGNKFLKGAGTVAKWGTAIAGAATAGGAALFGMATKSAEVTDRIDKLSNKIGISKQGFQEWDYILGQNGMDVEKLQVGVKTLVSQMDAAAGGSKNASEAFDKLGLSWNDGNGKLKNQESMMNEVIMALANMENGTEKARLATQLFGKAGVEMMPMLNNGAQGIEDLKNRAHDLGLVLGDDAVNAGVVLGDTLDDVKSSFSMIGTQIGVKVMPLIQSFADWILSNMPIIQTVLSGAFRGIELFVSFVVRGITTIADSVNDKFGWIIDKVLEMRDTFNNSMEEFDDYGQAFKSMLEVITGPIGDLPIFDEIGKVMSAIHEIIARVKNGEGIGEALRSAFEWRDSGIGNALIDLMNYCKNIFESIESVIRTVIENLGPIFEGLKDLFSITISALATIWENFGKPIWEFFIEAIQKVAEVFNYVFPILVDIFSGICDTLKKLWDSVLKPIFEAIGLFLETVLLPKWSSSFSNIGDIVKGAFSFIGTLWNTVLKPILDGIINFIGGIFSGNWSQIWDGIVGILKGIWGAVKMVLWSPIEWVIDKISGIVESIVSPFRQAANSIGNIWSSIKSVFKLPHFTIDGSLNPLKWIDQGMPKIGVDWYYKGGIFTEPTVLPGGIGVGDKFNGKGSNAEAVIPLDSMYENIRGIVKEESKSNINQNINIYSKTDSPSEIARRFRNEQRRLALEL
ncbi:phage tail protein [Clostridium tertium]